MGVNHTLLFLWLFVGAVVLLSDDVSKIDYVCVWGVYILHLLERIRGEELEGK